MELAQMKQRNRMLADLANRLTETNQQLRAQLDTLRSTAQENRTAAERHADVQRNEIARIQAEAKVKELRSHAAMAQKTLQQKEEQLKQAAITNSSLDAQLKDLQVKLEQARQLRLRVRVTSAHVSAAWHTQAYLLKASARKQARTFPEGLKDATLRSAPGACRL
jgi:DNA repair exonuclease SbcCD ATPase subunit